MANLLRQSLLSLGRSCPNLRQRHPPLESLQRVLVLRTLPVRMARAATSHAAAGTTTLRLTLRVHGLLRWVWIAHRLFHLANGALLYRLPPPSDRPWLRWVTAGVLIAALYGLPKWGGIWNDCFFGLIATACLWVFLSAAQPASERALFNRFSRGISRFSFTLYVVHVPFLLLLTSLAVGDGRWVPTPRSMSAGVAILLGTLAYAWLIASLTEFHTDRVRKVVERMLGMHVTPPSKHQKTLQA